jgi:hypothetical protein
MRREKRQPTAEEERARAELEKERSRAELRARAIRRVQLLLRLTESDNPHEAATAAAHAQAILTQHRLSMFELDGTPPEFERAPLDEPEARVRRWRELVAGAVVETNGCYCLVVRKRVGVPSRIVHQRTIYGTRANVETARYLYTYCCRLIEELAARAVRARFKVAGIATPGGARPRTWADSYRFGAASAIAERLRTSHRETLEQRGTGATLLALGREDAALRELIESFAPMPAPSALAADAEAYAQGREAGSSIDLGADAPQLEAGPERLDEGKP